MKKASIYLSVFLLFLASISCNNTGDNPDENTGTDTTVQREVVIEIENKTEEVVETSSEMEEEVTDLSNEVDSLLSDI